MNVTVEDLNRITASGRHPVRKAAFLESLRRYPRPVGRAELALLLSQVLHESGAFRYVAEVWGPTRAQLSYEGREGLGNTQPGDGYRFRGRDLIQVTGRANYRSLTEWLRDKGISAPDFEADPDLLADPAWLGTGVMWYWLVRIRPALIERGDVENVSRAVNGGTNGLIERFDWYTRAGLVLVGFDPLDVRGFQSAAGIAADGIPGPITRAAIHEALQTYDRRAPRHGAAFPRIGRVST